MGTANAGDFNYDRHGQGYARRRQADPRIAAVIHDALGSARTVLNVGAGAGSYEPVDRYVVAVEPSATMRAQRPPHLAVAIRGSAETLPLDDAAVDASMAILTVHQWPDPLAGLRELRRVTRGPVVILTFDPDAFDRFWLFEYAPELAEIERRRFPAIETIRAALGETQVRPVPVPLDCTDGFAESFYGRPELFLGGSHRARAPINAPEAEPVPHPLAGSASRPFSTLSWCSVARSAATRLPVCDGGQPAQEHRGRSEARGSG